MGGLLERIYGMLFQPVDTLRDISAQRPLGQTVLVLFAVMVFTTWAGYFTLWSSGIFICAAMLTTIFSWFVGTAIVHLFAELLGGSGQARGLLAASGFLQLPRIFSMPLLVLTSFLPAAVRPGVMLLGSLAIFCWEILLSVIAIRENYGFSTGRAVLAFAAPYVAVILSVGIAAAAIAKVLMQHMSQMGFGTFF